MTSRFTTNPDEDDKDQNDTGWGMTIAAGILWIAGILIIIGLSIWALILYARWKNVPSPRKCFVSSKDVQVAKESKDFLTEIGKRWEILQKYDCVNCSSCVPCEMPRPSCIGNLCVKDTFPKMASLRIPTKSKVPTTTSKN